MKRRVFLSTAGMGSAAAMLAAPALAQGKPSISWRLTSSYPKSLETLWGISEQVARRVSEMTDGGFQIQPFAAGEIVPGLQAIDAVSDGTVECAHSLGSFKIGTDPTIMLTGPVPVTEKILKDSGMSIGDIDLFEVNEAFAAVVLRFMQAFQVSPDKVNVNGGAMALGHPLGATGAIIIGTLLDELERRDLSTGLATLCIASGMGAATIIERV